MSFGFSVSDIYLCARLAYKLYEEFKQAPGACQEFARDLLLFHQVLVKTISAIDSETSHLSGSDRDALRLCLDSCKELLWVRILGSRKASEDLEKVGLDIEYPLFECFNDKCSSDCHHHYLGTWRHRFEKRKLALRIPKLQRAISAHIEKLNVLLILSNRHENQESQERIEKRFVESYDLLAQASTDHAIQLDSVSERLNASQARIESQLQAILANQQRSQTTSILSQSLDASSPEGRQTWMELGRLLRDEGIPPAMIQNNRGLLIDAMKNTLRNKSLLAESASESYATAPEYQVDKDTISVSQPRDISHLDLSAVSYPMSVLGSAPPRSSGFLTAFLERHHGSATCLDQRQNVDDGMESLLQGMSYDDLTPEFEPADGEHVQAEDLSFKKVPIHINDSPSPSSQKPLRSSKQKAPARILDLALPSIPVEDPPLCSNGVLPSKNNTSTSSLP